MNEVDSGVPAAGLATSAPWADATFRFEPFSGEDGRLTDLRLSQLDVGARQLLTDLAGPLELRGCGGDGPLDLAACGEVLRTGKQRERSLILGAVPHPRRFLAVLRREGPRLALRLREVPSEQGRRCLSVQERRSAIHAGASEGVSPSDPSSQDADAGLAAGRAVMDARGPAIWEWFPQRRTGTWSRGAEFLLGLELERLEPSPEWLLDCVEAEDRAGVQDVLERVLATGGGFSLRFSRGGRAPSGAELSLVGRMELEAPSAPRLVAVLNEAETRQAAPPPQRERMLGEVAREVIWEWRAETEQLSWGETLRSVFDWDPASAREVGWWRRAVHPEDAERVFSSLYKAVHSGARLWAQEFRLARGDGTYTPVRNRGSLERDPRGRLVRMVACLTDLSELQALEEERQAETSFRERFIGILGHDLRTPLNAISLSAQTLRRRTALTETQREVVGRIQSSTARMERMITEILDLTRARLAGGIPVRPSACDVHALSKRILKELQAVHPERPFSFEVHGPGAATVDAERLEQAVGNLISNACQHSPAGLSIEVESHTSEGIWTLRVHNWGPPIAPERLTEIFHPFRSGAVHRSARMGPGLGLGLYIVQEIAQAHGGAVTVDSNAEEGTCFVLTLPTHARTP